MSLLASHMSFDWHLMLLYIDMEAEQLCGWELPEELLTLPFSVRRQIASAAASDQVHGNHEQLKTGFRIIIAFQVDALCSCASYKEETTHTIV
ncbi:hypothetical protein F2P79_013317 [Pimephales promelas]|nr:hypothetical protein F2P79_013317 [Pimephales promelas]